jgi:threonine dehydrogenase-like Zn-dependent dehydrogenase
MTAVVGRTTQIERGGKNFAPNDSHDGGERSSLRGMEMADVLIDVTGHPEGAMKALGLVRKRGTIIYSSA